MAKEKVITRNCHDCDKIRRGKKNGLQCCNLGGKNMENCIGCDCVQVTYRDENKS